MKSGIVKRFKRALRSTGPMGEAQAGQFTDRFCDDVMEEAARTAAAQSAEEAAAAAADAEEKQPAQLNRYED